MPGVEHRQHRLGEHRPRAGAAHRQRAGAQEEHRADDLALDRRPMPAACERISARCSSVRRSPGSASVRQRAESGRDPVGGLVGGGEPLDHRRRLLHRGARLVGEPGRRSVAGDRDHVLGRRSPRPELDRGNCVNHAPSRRAYHSLSRRARSPRRCRQPYRAPVRTPAAPRRSRRRFDGLAGSTT